MIFIIIYINHDTIKANSKISNNKIYKPFQYTKLQIYSNNT